MKIKIAALSCALCCILTAVPVLSMPRVVNPRDGAGKPAEEARARTVHEIPRAIPMGLDPEELPAPESGEEKPDPEAVREVVYSLGNHVNVRSGPDTDHAVLGQLNRGETADRIGQQDGWSRLAFGDAQEAWVRSDLVTERPMNPRPVRAVPGDQTRDAAAVRARSGEAPGSGPFEAVEETLYCTGSGVNVRCGPGTEYEALGRIALGQTVTRTGIGDSGWSRIAYEGGEGYMSSRYLSYDRPRPGEARRPTPNAPFTYAYRSPEGIMPHGFFAPVDADPSRPLPLIISLHGASEAGKSQSYFENKFLVKTFRNWEYTGLQAFDAYIVCPHLSGSGYSRTWNNPTSADRLFALIDHLVANYNIDPDRILLQGQSMGAQGALYMAADSRACFQKLVLVSGYHPDRAYSHVSIPIRGYSGSPYLSGPREDGTSYRFMESAFGNVFGPENWYCRDVCHDEIPLVAFLEDMDGDGNSDLIQWLLS